MLTPSFGAGILIASLWMLLLFAFDPLIVQGTGLPEGIAWLRFCSPFYLALEVLMLNELRGLQCNFAPVSSAGIPSDTPIPISCEQYIYNLGLTPENFSFDIAGLIWWMFFYLCTAGISLKLFVKERR